MRRFICFLMTVLICMGLCGCKSEAVKNVEKLIDDIGTVTEYSEYQIEAAEQAYHALTEDEKMDVSNYNRLLDARNTYDRIPKAITLTPYNFKEYFAFSCNYGNTKRYNASGAVLEKTETTVEIYPVKPGTLSDVTMKLKIEMPLGYRYIDEGQVFLDADDFKDSLTLDIRMPADGRYSTTFNVVNLFEWGEPGSSCKFAIESISGTFEETK